MLSRSYTNLLDLTSLSPSSSMSRGLPRLMTEVGALSDCQEDDREFNALPSCGTPQSPLQERVIIVAHFLPLQAERDPSGSWSFYWDGDSLLSHVRDGLPFHADPLYVGCLNVDVDPVEHDEVAMVLMERFNCMPVFVPTGFKRNYFDGFCKQHVWPIFHYMLPITPNLGVHFDRALWQAYVSVNKMFADKVQEIINPEGDFVWVHNYHLMALPTFLRKRFYQVKLGFFLHTPFPSSEIYKTLPVREEILRGLLNADLIGFHTFDYARHFLSCCSRMLGLQFKSQRGYLSLEYYGRMVGIKIMPVGIPMERLINSLQMAETVARVNELQAELEGKVVMLGVDDLDVFQGISLKILAFEQLLLQHPEWRGKLVMVEIVNPANGIEMSDVEDEIQCTLKRVNTKFGTEGYRPVLWIKRPVTICERIAYYTIADCCVVTAVRDGLNLIPYEYTVCRQGHDAANARKQSVLVISEFIGCSPSLSGAIRVNPWNIDNVAEAMHSALMLDKSEKEMRHEKHYKYVSTHDVAYWVRSFFGDLKRTCSDHAQHQCWGIGFGFNFRIVALDPSFRKLSVEHIMAAYKRTSSRLILLDYDGTMVPSNSMDKTPSSEIISMLTALCNDVNNLVFIVSGRSRHVLHEWFLPCKTLGISAEHGYFNRWQQNEQWRSPVRLTDFSWKQVVEPVLRQYTESTDGSCIEDKESAVVWHYQNADPDFGSWQAKELLDHLESILADKPVVVKSGHHIVEVKPQGVSKGIVAEELLLSMIKREKAPDFVLCLGDDRSDEDMFESISSIIMDSGYAIATAEVFPCTVGQKPSKAKYYLEDTIEVVKMLQALCSFCVSKGLTSGIPNNIFPPELPPIMSR